MRVECQHILSPVGQCYREVHLNQIKQDRFTEQIETIIWLKKYFEIIQQPSESPKAPSSILSPNSLHNVLYVFLPSGKECLFLI